MTTLSRHAESSDFGATSRSGPRSLLGHLFSTRGRAGRMEYFLHSFLDAFVIITLLVLARILTQAAVPPHAREGVMQAAAFTVLSLASWSQIAVVIRRLNDLGRPRRDWVLMFCPIYNLYFGCVLLFTRGVQPAVSGPRETLALAHRLENDGDWEAAFHLYRQAALELEGEPDGEYAINCIRRLHERMELAEPDATLER